MNIRLFAVLFVMLGLLATAATCAGDDTKAPIRVGIIGLDAHAVPWTQILTNPQTDATIRELNVVAAVPAFSPDIHFSADNIQKNIQSMRTMGV